MARLVAYGAENASLTSCTYALPVLTAGGGSRPIQNGDWLFLYVATAGTLPALPDPNWTYVATILGPDTAEGPNGLRGTFMGLNKLYAGEAAPTITASGNHQEGHTFAMEPGIAGRMWSVQATGYQTVAISQAAMSFATLSNIGPDAIVALISAGKRSDATWRGELSWSNASLTDIAQYSLYIGFNTTLGTGSQFSGVTGKRSTLGSVGTTTANWELAMANQANMTVALIDAPLPSSEGSAAIVEEDSAVSATSLSATVGTAAVAYEDDIVAGMTQSMPLTGNGAIVEQDTIVNGVSGVAVTGNASIVAEDDTLVAAAGQGVPMSIGNATIKQRISAAQPTSGTWSTDPINVQANSLLYAALMRGKWANAALPREPSLSTGNVLNVIGAIHEYDGYELAFASVWYASQVTGNASTVMSATFGSDKQDGGDEVTNMLLEIIGVRYLQHYTYVERAQATSISGIQVIAHGPAVYVSTVCGSGPVAQTHNFQPSAPFIRVENASATGNPSNNGYIQSCTAVYIDYTGQYAGVGLNCTWTNPVTPEGGKVFNSAFAPEQGASSTGTIVCQDDVVSATAQHDAVGLANIAYADDAISGTAANTLIGAGSIVFVDDTVIGTVGALTVSVGNVVYEDEQLSSIAGQLVGAGSVAYADDVVVGAAAQNLASFGEVLYQDDSLSATAALHAFGNGSVVCEDDTVYATDKLPSDISVTVTTISKLDVYVATVRRI